MTLKTYRAASIADALTQIKADLGTDAVILHTRTFKHGGILGFNTKDMVEVTASHGVNIQQRRPSRPRNTNAAPSKLLRDTYTSHSNASYKDNPAEIVDLQG